MRMGSLNLRRYNGKTTNFEFSVEVIRLLFVVFTSSVFIHLDLVR